MTSFNRLRHARGPLGHEGQLGLYDDVECCYIDLDRLIGHGLVRLEGDGVRWEGC